MNPISSDHMHNIYEPHAAAQTSAKAENSPETREAETPVQHEVDRFLHTAAESPGKYWVEPGEKGPSVRFEAPRTVSQAAPAEPAGGSAPADSRPHLPEPEDVPEKEGKPAETTTCNTDKVDQELEALRRRAASLQQDMRSARSEEETAQLAKDLAAAERELALKDNDAYRRAHAHFS